MITKTPTDIILGSVFSLYHHKDVSFGRKLAVETIRHHIRSNTKYDDNTLGSADFFLQHLLGHISNKVKNMFTIKDVKFISTCSNDHQTTASKTIGPVIEVTTPNNYFFAHSNGKSSSQTLTKDGSSTTCKSITRIVKMIDSPLQLLPFLLFFKENNKTNTVPFPYEFSIQNTEYTIQPIIYLVVGEANHFYTITKIRTKNITCLNR